MDFREIKTDMPEGNVFIDMLWRGRQTLVDDIAKFEGEQAPGYVPDEDDYVPMFRALYVANRIYHQANYGIKFTVEAGDRTMVSLLKRVPLMDSDVIELAEEYDSQWRKEDGHKD
jgi:hypothetical protein